MTAQKPLAVRVLEQRKVPFELFEFDASIRSAAEVARATGMLAAVVLKTLVIEQDPPRGKPLLVMIPADGEVNLRVLAVSLGLKKLRMASHVGAERYTGLKVGGVSALALLGRGFAVLIEESATGQQQVMVSAGRRGLDVLLQVSDLLELTGATPVRVS